MNAVGIDLGGTKTLAVLLNEKGKILALEKIKSNFHSKKECIERITELIESVSKKKEFMGICIASRGLIDRKKGKIKSDILLQFLNGFEIKKALSKKFRGKKILVENDANCFIFAEQQFGAAKGLKNVIGLTLGTGIGGGIIIDGKPYFGQGNAAEIGHMVVNSRGKKCRCGRKGCIESETSASAILRRARKKGIKAKNTKELLEKAKNGNKKAMLAWTESAKMLGIALANIVNIFDPQAIIIGGGLANAWNEFIKPAEKTMKKELFSKSNVKIKKAEFIEIGVAAGAAQWVLTEENRKFWKQKKPLFAVDAIIKYYEKGRFKGIVLVERKKFPFGLSLPGGIVELGESAEKAIKREAKEETGLDIKIERQLHTYSNPKRDPRYHTIALAFIAKARGKIKAGSDAKNAMVYPLKKIPKKLCFGHEKVIRKALPYL